MNRTLKVLGGLALALLLAGTAIAQESEDEEQRNDLPPALVEKIQGLPSEKVEFLYTVSHSMVAATPEQFYAILEAKSPAEIEAYIDGMMQVARERMFDTDRDEASIPMNTDAPGFNGWKVRRPAAFSTPRDPGPINVQRYMGGSEQEGIPTFFKLPVAITPEDLVAGKVDVAIMGIPLDMGSGMRGAGYAPRAVRTGGVYGGWGMVRLPNMHTLVSPFNVLNMVDYGDIAVDNMSTERSLAHIREMVREVAETGTIPMIVGGDHSLMYPDAAGVVDVYGKGKVGIVHFDAHYDAGKGASGHLLTHGMPVYRLVKEGFVPGKNFIQVGLRGYWPGESGFKWMRENGFRYHTAVEIEKNGWDATMKRVMEEALDGPDYIYISFDIDVLDPAFAPGTGTPEPGGLTTREAFPLVRQLCAEKQVVGFELVEVNPLVDPGYTTALNADRILRECLTGIAMRKEGLTDRHYLSPLTVDHGVDE